MTKSHVGTTGNEKSDSVAKQAITKNEFNENIDLLIHPSII